jgi:hypothetical protein
VWAKSPKREGGLNRNRGAVSPEIRGRIPPKYALITPPVSFPGTSSLSTPATPPHGFLCSPSLRQSRRFVTTRCSSKQCCSGFAACVRCVPQTVAHGGNFAARSI